MTLTHKKAPTTFNTNKKVVVLPVQSVVCVWDCLNRRELHSHFQSTFYRQVKISQRACNQPSTHADVGNWLSLSDEVTKGPQWYEICHTSMFVPFLDLEIVVTYLNIEASQFLPNCCTVKLQDVWTLDTWNNTICSLWGPASVIVGHHFRCSSHA